MKIKFNYAANTQLHGSPQFLDKHREKGATLCENRNGDDQLNTWYYKGQEEFGGDDQCGLNS